MCRPLQAAAKSVSSILAAPKPLHTSPHIVPEGLRRAEEAALDVALPHLLAQVWLHAACTGGSKQGGTRRRRTLHRETPHTGIVNEATAVAPACDRSGARMQGLRMPPRTGAGDAAADGAVNLQRPLLAHAGHAPVSSQNPALLMPMNEWQASTCCATSGLVGATNTTLPCQGGESRHEVASGHNLT